MDFAIELYEAPDGQLVVEEEIDAIEQQTPALHSLLVAGLSKLRCRENHHPPLCAPLGDGLFELRVGRKDIARAAWFFCAGQRIVVVRCFVKKTRRTPAGDLKLAQVRMAEYQQRNAPG